MNRIILIRHGECAGKGVYTGRGSDVCLTAEGRDDMARLAEAMDREGVTPSRIVTSRLIRARESGRILAENLDFPLSQPELPADPRLDETDFGLFEGLSYEELISRYTGESQLWFDDSWNNAPPGGERTGDTAARVEEFYKELKTRFSDEEKDVLIVGHGGSLRLLICFLLGIPPEKHWHFRLDRGKRAVFHLAGDFPVIALLNG